MVSDFILVILVLRYYDVVIYFLRCFLVVKKLYNYNKLKYLSDC